MRNTRLLIPVAMLACWFFAPTQAEAESQMDVETLLAKVRKAQVPMSNLVLEVRHETVEPVRKLPRGVPNKFKKRHTKREYKVFISGIRSRMEYLQKSYYSAKDKEPYDVRRCVFVYDGTRWRDLDTPIKTEAPCPMRGAQHLYLTLSQILDQSVFHCELPFYNPALLNKYKISIVKNGSQGIYVLDAIHPRGWRYRLTIDGNRGYNITKLEHIAQDNRKNLELNTVLKKYEDDIWYPASREQIRYREEDKGVVEWRQNYTRVEFNAEIPEDTFDLKFPPGTELCDSWYPPDSEGFIEMFAVGSLGKPKYTREDPAITTVLQQEVRDNKEDKPVEIFGPAIERLVKSVEHGRDCFIDFDKDGLLSVPEAVHLQEQPEKGLQKWLQDKSVDAKVETDEGLCGLFGFNTAVVPVSNDRWNTISPAACHRVFEKLEGKGISPPIMSAEGKLPATFLFQTWDNRGVLQILEVQKDTEPRSIKVRYKMIEEAAQPEAKSDMDVETILEKVRKAQRPCENMRIEWVSEQGGGWYTSKRTRPENQIRLTRRTGSAVISGVRSRIEVRQETYYGKDVNEPGLVDDTTYVFDGALRRKLNRPTKGFRSKINKAEAEFADRNSSLLREKLFGGLGPPLQPGERIVTLTRDDVRGFFILDVNTPKGAFHRFTIDDSRGYNVIKQQRLRTDGSAYYEDNFELKQFPGGTWFISGRARVRFDTEDSKPRVDEEVTVTKAEFDMATPPDDTFKLILPRGTAFRYGREGFAVGSLGQAKHTEEDSAVALLLDQRGGKEETPTLDEVFSKARQRAVEGIQDRKDCFIDFDSDKLLSIPVDFQLRNEKVQKKWLKQNSIDAWFETNDGLRGLWTRGTVVIPVSNERWDSITPAACHRVFDKAKGIYPPIMSAEGKLPATFLFQTWDNRGILQILEVQKDTEPRYIKVRYKMIEEAAQPEAKSDMDVETILEKVRKAQRPAENMRIEWVNEIGPGEIYRGRPAPPAENRIRLSKLKGSAVLSGVRYRIEARGEYYYTEDRENPSRISHSLEVFDGTEQRQWIAPVKGRRSSRTQIGSGAIRLSHVNYSRLSMHLFGDNPLKLSDSQLRKLGFKLTTVESEAPGTFVLKAVAPKGNSYDLFTIDGNRGYNIIKHEHFRSSDGRKLSENNLTLKQYSDGRWFVSKRELVRFSEDVSETNVTEKMTVTNVQFDYQSREKDLFKLQFPERTSIRDGTFGYSHVFMLGCLSEPSHKTEDAAVTAIMEQATGEEKTAGKNEVFGSATERIVNSIEQRKDAFIDFDAGKLTAVPDDFHLNQEWKKWLEENGVDARVETDDGLCGLWTFNTVVIPVSNKRWDSITPAACHRVFDKVKGVYPPIMSAEGTLPATFLFQTWDNRGILQILEVRKDTEPRSIKVRYKIIQKKAQIGKGKKQVG